MIDVTERPALRQPLFAAAALSALLFLCACPVHASEQSEWHTVLGLISLGAGRTEAALTEFEAAVAADAGDLGALYQRSVALAKLGRWEESAADLAEVTKRDPSSSKAWLDFAAALFQLDRTDEAAAAAQEAAAFDDTKASAMFYSGLCEMRGGRLDEAETHLREAYAIDRDLEPMARYYLGVIAFQSSRYDDAEKHFDYVKSQQPDSEVGKRAVGYLESIADLRRARTSFYASIAFQYDSNVGLLNDLIEDALSQREDERFTLSAGVSTQLWASGAHALTVGYDFFQSLHLELQEFDLQDHHLWADLSSTQGALTLGLEGGWDYYLLDGSSFMDEFEVTPSLAWKETQSTRSELRYRWSVRNFHLRPFSGTVIENDDGSKSRIDSRDGMTHKVGLRQYFALDRGRLPLFAGYAYEVHDAENSDRYAEAYSYTGQQIELGASKHLAEGADIAVELRYTWEDYAPESAYFSLDAAGVPTGERRRDEEYRAVVALGKNISENLSVKLSYLYVNNQSKDELFDYQRHIGSLSVELTR